MLKRTPLFSRHQALGGRLIEFGGWEMPAQYTSIVDEHNAVRSAAGVFDISHMGEVFVRGEAAGRFLNGLLTNDATQLIPGLGQYTLMCNPDGGVIDDLYLYRLGENEYFLIINASRIEADTEWMRGQLGAFTGKPGVVFEDASDKFGAIAIQGPRVPEFIDTIIHGPSIGGTVVARASGLRKNEIAIFQGYGATAVVARTGYTGEQGFEIAAPSETIGPIWDKTLEAGKPFGLVPAGLGARDTLRTEACYPLYGHELDEKTTPIEAGLGYFVALGKPEFIGRAKLAAQKAAGPAKKLVAFKMAPQTAPPRPGYAIWSANAEPRAVGVVVSGTPSPSLGVGIGMGYVPPEFATPGTPVAIEIRGRRAAAEISSKPLLARLKQPKAV
jgi:aminomethyltransferase